MSCERLRKSCFECESVSSDWITAQGKDSTALATDRFKIPKRGPAFLDEVKSVKAEARRVEVQLAGGEKLLAKLAGER